MRLAFAVTLILLVAPAQQVPYQDMIRLAEFYRLASNLSVRALFQIDSALTRICFAGRDCADNASSRSRLAIPESGGGVGADGVAGQSSGLAKEAASPEISPDAVRANAPPGARERNLAALRLTKQHYCPKC